MPRAKFRPDENVARQVEKLAALGISQEDAGSILNFSVDTLMRRYSEAWIKGKAVAKANIAGKLYNLAMNGDKSSIFFWLKTQAGWRETQHVDMTSSDGSMVPVPLDINVTFVDAQERKGKK